MQTAIMLAASCTPPKSLAFTTHVPWHNQPLYQLNACRLKYLDAIMHTANQLPVHSSISTAHIQCEFKLLMDAVGAEWPMCHDHASFDAATAFLAQHRYPVNLVKNGHTIISSIPDMSRRSYQVPAHQATPPANVLPPAQDSHGAGGEAIMEDHDAPTGTQEA